jgi:hypothetical protein
MGKDSVASPGLHQFVPDLGGAATRVSRGPGLMISTIYSLFLSWSRESFPAPRGLEHEKKYTIYEGCVSQTIICNPELVGFPGT